MENQSAAYWMGIAKTNDARIEKLSAEKEELKSQFDAYKERHQQKTEFLADLQEKAKRLFEENERIRGKFTRQDNIIKALQQELAACRKHSL